MDTYKVNISLNLYLFKIIFFFELRITNNFNIYSKVVPVTIGLLLFAILYLSLQNLNTLYNKIDNKIYKEIQHEFKDLELSANKLNDGNTLYLPFNKPSYLYIDNVYYGTNFVKLYKNNNQLIFSGELSFGQFGGQILRNLIISNDLNGVNNFLKHWNIKYIVKYKYDFLACNHKPEHYTFKETCDMVEGSNYIINESSFLKKIKETKNFILYEITFLNSNFDYGFSYLNSENTIIPSDKGVEFSFYNIPALCSNIYRHEFFDRQRIISRFYTPYGNCIVKIK